VIEQPLAARLQTGSRMSWHDPLQDHPRYQRLRVLGQGAQSTVVLAQERATGQKVAIKLISRGWPSNQTKYVLREVLIHQELTCSRHPHIVEFKEVFLTPSHLGVVMEAVEGEDLQSFLVNTGGRVSEALARFLFQQLVLALDFCHRKGKVSRNIKLANTLLALAPGQLPLVKLSDFGFSKDTMRHSAAQSQVGAALFAAPEVVHNFSKSSYNAAMADVWSCGIVLFVLLYGRHPFLRPEDARLSEQQQMLALFSRTAAGSFVLSGEDAGLITPACADLLGGMLQPDPAKRVAVVQVMSHPWFKQGLPEGATMMNDLILSEHHHTPGKQSPQELAALVKAAQTPCPNALAMRFNQSGDMAGGGGVASAATAAVRASGVVSNGETPY